MSFGLQIHLVYRQPPLVLAGPPYRYGQASNVWEASNKSICFLFPPFNSDAACHQGTSSSGLPVVRLSRAWLPLLIPRHGPSTDKGPSFNSTIARTCSLSYSLHNTAKAHLENTTIQIDQPPTQHAIWPAVDVWCAACHDRQCFASSTLPTNKSRPTHAALS